MGQLYALATPNEESANGLGGLSVMLSVILMGFLITYAAMPDGWKWAYWANLFHYILQGLVTNELAGSDYHLDVGKILGGATTVDNFAFDGGNQAINNIFAFDGGDQDLKEQLSSILALVAEAPEGTNPDSGNLGPLIECTLASGCFEDEEETLSAGFINCYLFSGLRSDPPCNAEFDALKLTANPTEIGKCFFVDESGFDDGHLTDILSPVPQVEPFVMPSLEQSTAPMAIHRQLLRFPGETPDDSIPEEDKDGSRDLVLCLVGALLPQDALNEIMDIANNLLGIAGFVFDVVENGISIPGELILFVFGWAEYVEGEGFVAPWKWYYCMFSVAIFLIAIEIFKLIAVRFIVWTKR